MLFDVMKGIGWNFSAVKEKTFFTCILIPYTIQEPEKVIREK